MKIAFVGKGGSGKTTISSLFSRYIASQKLPILTIDADINQHMGVALGLSEDDATKLPPIGLEINKIKEYLRHKNSRISSINIMVKTTPPGMGSRLISVTEENPIFKHFAKNIEGVQLLAVGPFSKEDLGIKCYHSKTGAAELLLSHLIDKKGEYVVMDMTAGADSFASGMFTKFDVTFLVVEPTIKSVGVFKQYKKYAEDHNILIKVIGNKIEDEEDIVFLKEHVGSALLTWFKKSSYVRKLEKGQHQPISNLEKENIAVLKKIKQTIDTCNKDWESFYRHTVEFHIRNANSWASKQAGEDLTKQIDPNFSLAKIAK